VLSPDADCPCQSGLAYGPCCGRWHAGPQRLQAPDALALMRSRYSAYVLDLRDYLLDTWHPSRRPAALAAPEPGLKWLGLTIKQHVVRDAQRAEVAFVARSKLAGRAHRLQERSRFVNENGRWLYLDGDPG
jgi:SEC-C motif domain protein